MDTYDEIHDKSEILNEVEYLHRHDDDEFDRDFEERFKKRK